MHRRSFVIQLVALALAVLLPVEAAHCAWMMSPIAKTATGMRADHACCRTTPAKSSAPSAPQKAAPDCACLSLPQAVAAAVSVTPAAPEAAQAVTILEVLAAPAASVPLETREADASPPRAPSLTAHPLRGPPSIS